MDRDQIIQLMTQRNLFEGATPEVLGDLVDHGEVVSVVKDDFLIKQGNLGEAVWVLLDGTVTVMVDEKEPRELREPGTILGEISAVSRTAATASVLAASDLSALRIHHQDFHKALASSSKLATSVLRSLSKYLG